jgi:hypothetical protein
MYSTTHGVLDTCFVNLHNWCGIAPVPVPAMCRVIQSARSRLHGHAKAKRDRTSGRSRVVEATKEHYLAWRDKMGRQRAGPGGSNSVTARIFAAFGITPICVIMPQAKREPEQAARWRQARRTAAEVTRARVSRSVPIYAAL